MRYAACAAAELLGAFEDGDGNATRCKLNSRRHACVAAADDSDT